jgi:hypothetical protein
VVCRVTECDRESSTMRSPWSTDAVAPWHTKKNLRLHVVCSIDTSKGQGKFDLVEAVKAYGVTKS